MHVPTRILAFDDPRLAPYRAMKDRDLATMPGGLFIAEGEQVVRRLLSSGLRVHSVLVAERHADEIGPLVPEDVPFYVAPSDIGNGVIGFKFHSGVIAVGRRPPSVSLN